MDAEAEEVPVEVELEAAPVSVVFAEVVLATVELDAEESIVVEFDEPMLMTVAFDAPVLTADELEAPAARAEEFDASPVDADVIGMLFPVKA